MKHIFVFQDNLSEILNGELLIKSKEDGILLSKHSLLNCFPFLDSRSEKHSMKNFFCIFSGSLFLLCSLFVAGLIVFLIVAKSKNFIPLTFVIAILLIFTYFFFSHIRRERREYFFYSYEWGDYVSIGVCHGRKTEEEKNFIEELTKELKRCSLMENKMDKNMDPFAPEYHSILALCGNSDQEKREQHIPLYHKIYHE